MEVKSFTFNVSYSMLHTWTMIIFPKLSTIETVNAFKTSGMAN